MRNRIIFFVFFSLLVSGLIAWIFWEHEIKYATPTPVPKNFKSTSLGETIDLNGIIAQCDKPTVLHFFNQQCPCSKFNMRQFKSVSRKYSKHVNFYVVLQAEEREAIDDFNDRYELDLPVILDSDGSISDHCGIYSTPQAVILDKHSVLYFKGNYNKARFCTRRETSYVEIALDSLVKNKPLPLLVQNELTLPYGCTLPSDEVADQSMILNLLNNY